MRLILKYTSMRFVELVERPQQVQDCTFLPAPNVNLSCEGVIDGEGLGHHFLLARRRAFPLFE